MGLDSTKRMVRVSAVNFQAKPFRHSIAARLQHSDTKTNQVNQDRPQDIHLKVHQSHEDAEAEGIVHAGSSLACYSYATHVFVERLWKIMLHSYWCKNHLESVQGNGDRLWRLASSVVVPVISASLLDILTLLPPNQDVTLHHLFCFTLIPHFLPVPPHFVCVAHTLGFICFIEYHIIWFHHVSSYCARCNELGWVGSQWRQDLGTGDR